MKNSDEELDSLALGEAVDPRPHARRQAPLRKRRTGRAPNRHETTLITPQQAGYQEGRRPCADAIGYRCTCGHVSWWSFKEAAEYAAKQHERENTS